MNDEQKQTFMIDRCANCGQFRYWHMNILDADDDVCVEFTSLDALDDDGDVIDETQ